MWRQALAFAPLPAEQHVHLWPELACEGPAVEPGIGPVQPGSAAETVVAAAAGVVPQQE